VLVGVAASGRTPFTLAAMAAARAAGALTVGIANNPGSALLSAGDHGLLANTGSEIVAGSTRMKAGTAQKAVLNMFSTAIMLRRGLIYRGLMVNMRVSNEKLLGRAQAMVRDLAGVGADAAARALETADREIGPAVLVALGASPDEAARLLAEHEGDLRKAVAEHVRTTGHV
jgi:N-acetylmuramic acid 6-phosphate etherase